MGGAWDTDGNEGDWTELLAEDMGIEGKEWEAALVAGRPEVKAPNVDCC